jgi:hypothetical protein
MFGAELSEVWQDYKPKKNKKKKDKPLTPEDMDSGLLLGKREKSLVDEKERLSSLVDDRDKDYKYERINPNVVTFEDPYGASVYDKKSIRPSRIEDDPDYNEFLEFKKNKNSLKRDKPIIQKLDTSNDNDQLNELILYIFTGFFLLVLYDNIYRLGKKSY